MIIYVLTGLALLIYLVVAYLIGSLLKLHGTELWVLRIALALIGVAAAVVSVRFFASLRKKKPVAPVSEQENDIQSILREAEAKLSSSRLGKTSYGSLPAVLIIGDSSSGKTTAVVQSGLEPELLAGHVAQEEDIAPTQLLNIWFAAKAVFVEAAAKVLNTDASWLHLIRRLQPGKVASLFGNGVSAARAIVVCVEAASFVTAGGPERQMQNARRLRERLNALSDVLGINVPVYVLFTKLDEISFFGDFVNNLEPEEVRQVIGVTLPRGADQGAGTFAENATRTLTDAFDKLFLAFAAKRPDLLSRESNALRLPGTYEFPREFRKLRTALVKFLVDLCRPNQLKAGPFLRGFYFCGVRSVAENDVVMAPVAQAVQKQDQLLDVNATVMFRPGQPLPGRFTEAPATSSTAREIPQWVFLNRFFGDVVLADNAAARESGSSAKTNAFRRMVLATLTALSLSYAAALLLSYAGNRQLQTSVLKAAQAIPPAAKQVVSLPPLDSLQRLEDLRQALGTLATYNREGPPLRLRWGIYSGGALYPAIRTLYFDRFRQLLLGPAQARLLTTLNGIPNKPGSTDQTQLQYESLKAYLITSSHHEKSTKEFLAPFLLARLAPQSNADPAVLQLAQKQLQFYAEELQRKNPYSSENDAAAVSRARKYLLQFTAAEPVYQAMLGEANRRFETINFNRKFPGSATVVTDNRDVNGAYSKEGWSFMQEAIKNPSRYFKGEQWVLGEQGRTNVDLPKLQQDLTTRYDADFITQWRTYLLKANVVPYLDLEDASAKLSRIASPDSPLLAMFCLASQNTSVESPEVLKAFKSVHTVMPPTCGDSYVAPANKEYMTSLINLQDAVKEAVASPQLPNPAAPRVSEAARSALSLVGQMSLTFGSDRAVRLEETTKALLEAPITNAKKLLDNQAQQQLNAEGKQFCSDAKNILFDKIPFNPRSKTVAAMADVDGVFRPGRGQLWTFYDKSLSKILTLQGSEYRPDPAGKVVLNENFVRFFNRVAAFSKALYPTGAADPGLTFSLMPNTSEDLTSVHLSVNGQTAQFTGRGAPGQQFRWPGTGDGVHLSATDTSGAVFPYPTWSGLWGVFNFFSEADSARPSSIGGVYDWRLISGSHQREVTTSSGRPVVVELNLDMGGLPNVFRKGYLAELSCVAEIAKP